VSGVIAKLFRVFVVALSVYCGGCATDAGTDAPVSYLYADPQPVTIEGYDGDAMEPFLARDGRYLFFNNSNHPSVDTNLHYAERMDDLRFRYRGEVRGANTTALDAVATMDRSGVFYFVSLRDHEKTLHSIFRGEFRDGALSGVEPVRGISRKKPLYINFDLDISPDGERMYVVDGRFDLLWMLGPKAADIVVADRRGDGFAVAPDSAAALGKVNTDALEYAPCISADGRTLLLTRMRRGLGAEPAIYVAQRDDPSQPFGPARRLAALEGFVEATTFTVDERSIYYHRKVDDRFVLFMATKR
jgi:WD40-like Beta Propeller Repeat